MGMFDNITCEYPLPGNAPEEVKKWVFQTKDTPMQFLEDYRITVDGRLQHRSCTYEDRSDPTAEGIMALAGCMTRIPGEWVDQVDFVGKINFYGSNWVASGPGNYTKNGEDLIEVEWQAIIVDGKLLRIKEIEYKVSPAWKFADWNKHSVEHIEGESHEDYMKRWNAKKAEFEAYQASELERRKNGNAS